MSRDYPELLLENQLCFPLYAASKALVRRYEPLLKPFGLTYTQFIVMMVIWEKERIDVKELGELVCLDSGTLSPLLNRLIGKGFIAKGKHGDGRYRYIEVTEAGWELREEVKGIPNQIGSCLPLDHGEVTKLYETCYKITGGLK